MSSSPNVTVRQKNDGGTRKMSYLDHNNHKDSQLTNNEIN